MVVSHYILMSLAVEERPGTQPAARRRTSTDRMADLRRAPHTAVRDIFIFFLLSTPYQPSSLRYCPIASPKEPKTDKYEK